MKKRQFPAFAIIYKITCNITGEIYIGSTLDAYRRLKEHESEKNKTSSHSIIERGDYTVKHIINGIFEDNNELLRIEQYYIDKYQKAGNCVNMRKAINDKYERKKKIKICECGLEISARNMARHRNTILHIAQLNKCSDGLEPLQMAFDIFH